jgi:NADPH-ferrihemoprotein reductase
MEVDLLDVCLLLACLLGALFVVIRSSPFRSKSEITEDAEHASADYDDRNIVDQMKANGKNVIIFYGSQTGTAEAYSSKFAKEISSRFGLKAMAADLDEYDFESLDVIPEDHVAVFMLATFGEGEPTDNAANFNDFIMSDEVNFSKDEISSSPLRNLNYIVFGLGNSTYEKFNAMGRNLETTLQGLGAHRIGRYGEGDDGAGTTEEDYLAWKEDVFAAWKQEKGLEEKEVSYEPSIEVVEEENGDQVFLGELSAHDNGQHSASNPFVAPVVSSRELFNSNSRNCIHMEFDISGSGMKYETGDHLGLFAPNSSREVDRFLTVFGLTAKRDATIEVRSIDPTAKVHFPAPTTYDAVVRYFLDINGAVSRQLVSSFAAFAPSEDAKANASRLGADRELFTNTVTQEYLNLAQLLHRLSDGKPWTAVPFSFLIESLQQLHPRYYSISSSSAVDRNIVSISAVVESVDRSSHTFMGVSTNYILDIKNALHGSPVSRAAYQIGGPRGKYAVNNQIRVPIHIRHSTFKLPKQTTPVIMVGPGTGVAPFRGFIQERAVQTSKGSVGKSLLFFGSRTSSEDYLYGDEWTEFTQSSDRAQTIFSKNNFLEVITAFSRESNQKLYVQHRLEQQSQYVNQLLEQGAYFYVCGDASRMARDVHSTLVRIISKEQGVSIEQAEGILKTMKAQNRYQEDVW